VKDGERCREPVQKWDEESCGAATGPTPRFSILQFDAATCFTSQNGLPNLFQSLFALAKRCQIDTLDISQWPVGGDGHWYSQPEVIREPWIGLLYRYSFEKNAFRIYWTDATGFSGTADDAALRYATACAGSP
jgi:hypothetical protein